MLRVSTTQFDLKKIDSDKEFFMRCEKLIQEASEASCEVILFPEYFSLSQLLYEVRDGNFQERLRTNLDHTRSLLNFFKIQSQQKKIVILAGTLPVSEGSKLLNRCHVIFPDGKVLHQDKVQMTRFESEEWNVQSGPSEILQFEIKGFKCSVCICYDVEFPHLTAIDSHVIFVPSNTDDIHGYWRVRLCSQARTVENQCYTVMSACVGGDSRHPEIAEHHGQSGIYSPSDIGFKPGGVLALGEMNKEGLCFGDLDLVLLENIRKNGTVLNLRDR